MKLHLERLHHELDKAGTPSNREDRIEAVAKWLKINKYASKNLLYGSGIPTKTILEHLCEELEVDEAWLLGK